MLSGVTSGDPLGQVIDQLRPGDSNIALFADLNAWVYSSLARANTSATDANGIINSLAGICGHRDIVLEAAAGRLGIAARPVGFANVPYQNAHVATEVFLDGEWRFFDSTSGIYLTLAGDDNPIGIEKARDNWPNVVVHQAKAQRWLGAWQAAADFEYDVLTENLIYVGSSPIFDIERTYFISNLLSEAAVQESSLTISLNLNTAGSGTVGTANHSSADVASAFSWASSSWATSIGPVSGTNLVHDYVLQTNTTRYVEFTVFHQASAEGALYADLELFNRVDYGQDIVRTTFSDRTTFAFVIDSPGAVLRLSAHGSSTVQVDALAWTSSSSVNWSNSAMWSRQLVGDFNGDNRDDVASFNQVTGAWWVGLSQTDGTFKTSLWSQFSTKSGWTSQIVGDFNGDGLDDIANFHSSNSTWWVSLSRGTSFTTPLWAQFSSRTGWTTQLVGDFNGDGLDDIANFNSGNSTWWISLSRGTSFTTPLWSQFFSRTGWTTQLVGDFNGDGLDDIANFNSGNSTWWVSLSQGTSFTTPLWSQFSSRTGWTTQLVGDFNGDGKADIANFNSINSTWWVGVSQANAFTTSLWAQFSSLDGWTSQRAADFNGDGRTDIANYNQTNGTWWVSLSNGKSLSTTLWGDDNDANAWNLALVGDFNADGQADLTNFHAGRNVGWLASSVGSTFARDLTQRTSSAPLLTAISSSSNQGLRAFEQEPTQTVTSLPGIAAAGSAGRTSSIPVFLPLDSSFVAFGTLNGSSSDLGPLMPTNYGETYAGVPSQIGKTKYGRLQQTFILDVVQSSRVTLVISSIRENTPALTATLLQFSQVTSTVLNIPVAPMGQFAVLQFTVQAPGAILRIEAAETKTFYVDAYTWTVQ